MTENLGEQLSPRERLKLIRKRVVKRRDERMVRLMQEAIRKEKNSQISQAISSNKTTDNQINHSSPESSTKVDFVKLAEALTLDNQDGSNRQVLTMELATHFNQRLGGSLDGATQMKSLLFPRSVYIKKTVDAKEREQLSKVNIYIRTQYNRVIQKAMNVGIKNVSELREMSTGILLSKNNMGPLMVGFLSAAFKPPLLPKP